MFSRVSTVTRAALVLCVVATASAAATFAPRGGATPQGPIADHPAVFEIPSVALSAAPSSTSPSASPSVAPLATSSVAPPRCSAGRRPRTWPSRSRGSPRPIRVDLRMGPIG